MKKIKASALFFALLAATLIALLLSSFLLLSKTQRIFQIKNNTLLVSLQAVTEGLEDKLETSELLNYRFENRGVSTMSEAWGGFLKVTAKDTTDTFGMQKQALTGNYFVQWPSIILADHFSPLNVAGDARIEGMAYLPESGVESSAIAGSEYIGERLIYGPYQNVSSIGFPKIDKAWLSETQALIDQVSNSESLQKPGSKMGNSFQDENQDYFYDDIVRINQDIAGQITIRSSREISIGSEAQISDVRFIAPKIKIEDGFEGRLHAIATDSIIVGQGVTLNYPSSLVVSDRSMEESTGSIVLMDNTNIEGNLIYLNQYKNNENLNANVFIREEALVKGAIYCEGATELIGTLKGSLITQYTIAHQNSQKYHNYIFNGRIITTELPTKFAGLPLAEGPKSVALWLY